MHHSELVPQLALVYQILGVLLKSLKLYDHVIVHGTRNAASGNNVVSFYRKLEAITYISGASKSLGKYSRD